MVQPATEKLKHTSRETLCDTCKNAVPQLCVYMRSKPKDVEAALAAMGAEATKYTWAHANCGIYRVTSCPKYVPGALPRIAEGRPAPRRETELLDKISAGYDFSCPHCGSVNGVKVARTSLLKPEDWYCRCSNCVKSFRPRKNKEVKKLELVNETTQNPNENTVLCNENPNSNNNSADLCNAEPEVVKQDPFEKQPDRPKTRMEVVKEKLTKEQYLAMKAENMSDSTIMKNIFGKYMADILTALKKEWGLEGLGLKKLPYQEKPEIKDPEPNTFQEPPTSEKEEPEITIGDILDDLITDNVTADDDKEITFIIPCKQIKEPVLRVCNKGIMFNNSACRLLEGVTSVRVGVTKNRVIVLVPSEPSNKTYKIGTIKNSKQGGLKIGGGVLLAGLKKSGITEGRYRLEKNEAKGRFEARTDEVV